MSDTDRFVAFLAERRAEGLHSGEIRRLGISGNPSQRAKDAVDQGTGIFKARENVGRRQGVRFWLAQYAPDFAVPVAPNRPSEPSSATNEGTDAEAAPPDASDAPTAPSLPSSGQLFEMPDRPTSAITGREAA